MSDTPADLILYNAEVITCDCQTESADGIAIRGNKILAVGKYSDVSRCSGPQTSWFDCRGGTIIPGFNDAHCHPVSLAATLMHIDCSPSAVRSIADIIEKIGRAAAEALPGRWLRAAGYNEHALAEKRRPTRRDLDQAAPTHPVILLHHTTGFCVLNSAALHRLGLPEESDGVIDGADESVMRGVPPLSAEEWDSDFKRAGQLYLSNGITSLQDTGWNNGLPHWRAYQKCRQKGLLPTRISMLIGSDTLAEILGSGLRPDSGDHWLRLGGVKIAPDEKSGFPHPPQETVNALAVHAHRAGFRLAFHVHDGYDLRAALTALGHIHDVLREQPVRPRLEHCFLCTPALLDLLKKTRPVIVTQPSFLFYHGEELTQAAPPQTGGRVLPLASYVKAGADLALSSDSPMTPVNPLVGIQAAVARKDIRGKILAGHEAITPMQALKMYTLGGAYASGEEDVKGSITPGKLADLAVLDRNPNLIKTVELKDIRVMMTMIDGQIVWERN